MVIQHINHIVIKDNPGVSFQNYHSDVMPHKQFSVRFHKVVMTGRTRPSQENYGQSGGEAWRV